MEEGNWVTAWLGRGPLSTTITTDRTFQDEVPDLGGRTLRLVVHLALGGVRARVRLSQRYSTEELRVAEARIAWSHRFSAVLPGSDRPLTFGGKGAVTVPGGGDLWSDPVDLLLPDGDIALSFYLPGPCTPTTQGGRGQTKTSYHAPGNQAAAPQLREPEPTRQVFVAFEVQVWSPVPASTIVALGDSITEGACSTLDANASWPELFARHLSGLPGKRTSIVNAGIGSGRWASADAAGQRGRERLHELLKLPHLAGIIVHMGVNDISYEGVSAEFLIEAFAQAITDARRAGVALAVVPILPFGRSTKDVGSNVSVAQRVNAWIRDHDGRRGASEPCFDAVLDVEAALRGPGPGWTLRSDLSADGVHPNQDGYSAFAQALALDGWPRVS